MYCTRSRLLVTGTAVAFLLTIATPACGASGGSDALTGATTTGKSGDTTTSTGGDVTATTENEVSTTSEGTTTTEDDTTTTAGEPSGDPRDYIDALVASFETDTEEILEPDQVQCVAENFVEVVGIEALEASGISPEEFADGDGSKFPPELGIDEAKAIELFDQFDICGVDVAEAFSKALAGESGGLTAEQQACIDKVITEENVRESFVAGFTGKVLADDPLAAADECLNPN